MMLRSAFCSRATTATRAFGVQCQLLKKIIQTNDFNQLALRAHDWDSAYAVALYSFKRSLKIFRGASNDHGSAHYFTHSASTWIASICENEDDQVPIGNHSDGSLIVAAFIEDDQVAHVPLAHEPSGIQHRVARDQLRKYTNL